jgi:hypothetical protein
MLSQPMPCSVYVAHMYTLKKKIFEFDIEHLNISHAPHTHNIKDGNKSKKGIMKKCLEKQHQDSYLDIDNLVYERYPWKNEEINPIVFFYLSIVTQKMKQENENLTK